jgi:hypothetical protein
VKVEERPLYIPERLGLPDNRQASISFRALLANCNSDNRSSTRGFNETGLLGAPAKKYASPIRGEICCKVLVNAGRTTQPTEQQLIIWSARSSELGQSPSVELALDRIQNVRRPDPAASTKCSNGASSTSSTLTPKLLTPSASTMVVEAAEQPRVTKATTSKRQYLSVSILGPDQHATLVVEGAAIDSDEIDQICELLNSTARKNGVTLSKIVCRI